MSQPVPGNYFIINADVFPGLGLAMTFNGQDQNVTVTGLVSDVNDQSFLNQVVCLILLEVPSCDPDCGSHSGPSTPTTRTRNLSLP